MKPGLVYWSQFFLYGCIYLFFVISQFLASRRRRASHRVALVLAVIGPRPGDGWKHF